MALYDSEGKLIEGTEGRVISLEHRFSYWGDGDGTYYWIAIVATDDGYEHMKCGKDQWNAYGMQADAMGSEVDAPRAVINNYPVWKREQDEKKEKANYNNPYAYSGSAYEMEKGRLGFVEKGTRKRKHQGAWGHVIWIGTDRYGNTKCGLKNPDTQEVAWVPAYQVVIVPDYDDFETTQAMAAD